MFEQQRLHPAAILEYLWEKGRRLLEAMLPLIIVFIGRAESRRWVLPVLICILVIFCVYIFLYWTRYVFYIAGSELRVEYGVLIRKKRYVPRERIQSLQITSGIVQRWFGLVKLEVETAAGANQVEISLPALTRQQAEELAGLLQHESFSNTLNPEQSSQPLLKRRLSFSGLLIAASTSNGIGIVLALVLALLSQIDRFLPLEDLYEVIGQYFINSVVRSDWTVLLILLLALVVAWVLSALGSIITLSGFTLQRNQERLFIRHGLLERKQISIPVKRIQALLLVEGVLRQPFHLGHAALITAGYTGKGVAANLLYPILHRGHFVTLLQEFLPELATVDLKVRKLPREAIYRYIYLTALPFSAAAIPLLIYVDKGYLGAIPLLLAALLLGLLRYRDAGWQIHGDKLIIRGRVLGKSTSIVPRQRIQSLSFSQSWLQARKSLGSLKVTTASGTGGASFKIVGISQADAVYLMAWFQNPFIMTEPRLSSAPDTGQ
jgi:putative membrane protein